MTGEEFRHLALSMEGAVEVEHFKRRAFRLRRIFASLAPDEQSVNIFISPEEQEQHAGMRPDLFSAVPNKWGQRGWTQVNLADADKESVRPLLRSAWLAAGGAGLK